VSRVPASSARAGPGLPYRPGAAARGRALGDGKAGRAWVSLLIGAAVWEVAGRALHFSFLPPFSAVVRALAGLVASGQILGNLWASLLALALGYGLAAAAGILVGLLMGRYEAVEYVAGPFVNAFLAAPKLVFVPILYAFFGIGRGTQVAVVFLNAFFIIAINTMSGIRSVNHDCVEMARAFCASEGQLLRKVLLPGALPLTLAGLRVGVGRAVKGMISGEMFIALFGLGALLRKYGGRFDSERVYAVLLVVVAVAMLCSGLMAIVERRLTRWMEPRP